MLSVRPVHEVVFQKQRTDSGVRGRPRNVQVGVQVVMPGREVPPTPAQRAGLVYERKALAWLDSTFADLRCKQWIRFDDDTGGRLCQPDAYVVIGPRVVVFEVKVRHTASAYQQLKHLYIPVLRTQFGPRADIVGVEVTKSYDGRVATPEEPRFLLDTKGLMAWLDESPRRESWAALQWRPE